MKPSRASRIAWATCVLALAMIFGFVPISLLNHNAPGGLSFTIVGISSAVVGGMVASRRPENPVGWIFLGGALIPAFRTLTGVYAIYGISTDPGALPFPEVAALLSSLSAFAGPVLSFILLPLYFPNGRTVSRRWSLATWLALAMMLVATLLETFSPGEVMNSGIPNPFAIEALRPVENVLGPPIFVWYIGLIFVAAASLVVRFRRAGSVERQQIKWFTFAAAAIPVWFVVNSPVERAAPNLFAVMDALVIAAVPIAAGIAILRYRLYDIDRIINRTLVYGALTISLVLAYFGGVAMLQALFRALAGETSQIAVVASTLAIAALFNPLRRRVQEFIDRRFYRKKYNAARTLEDFSLRLRDETDLDALSSDFVGVVRNTMQPAHVSLWLKRPHADRMDKEWDR